ncbi:MAG: cytochrome c peroxidase [Pseudomonadota bacterium]
MKRTPAALGIALTALCTLVFESAQGSPNFGQGGGGWNAEELAVLTSLRIRELPAAPRDLSNAFQDSAAAAALGKLLFFDTRFSRNQAVSCASCHDPGRQFQDGRAVGVGLGVGSRRSMPIVGAGFSPWLFWDGRKDSVWSQALGPLEDPVEHGGNRLQYARLMQMYYRQTYQEIFGPLPEFSHLPEDAGPRGSTAEKEAWLALDEAARDGISRVFANMGKAIAAYEKTLSFNPSRLDLYINEVLNGKRDVHSVFTPQEVRGLRLFIGKGQCVSCHNGPLLTDQQFHNTGVPPRDPDSPDQGRASALSKVRDDEFNCAGRFSDAKLGQCEELRFLVAQDGHTVGAFKTPGLRDVALRPPYMHAGQFASLDAVVLHYVNAPHAAVGHSELTHLHKSPDKTKGETEARRPIDLSPAEQQDLVAFLQTLSTN